jgi:hypothetical protein
MLIGNKLTMPLSITKSGGIVNLFMSMSSRGVAVGGLILALPLRGYGWARDLLPYLESLNHPLAILGGVESVASRSEVLGDGTIRREKPLGVPWRLEPLHPPLQLACRLMGVFRPVVERAVLPMLDTG